MAVHMYKISHIVLEGGHLFISHLDIGRIQPMDVVPLITLDEQIA